MERKVVILDGTAFCDLDGFYAEAERALTSGPARPMGRNLDALRDVLRGGFGVHAPGQPLAIVWRAAGKSRRALGYAATAAHWQQTLEHCHPANRARIEARRDAALRGEGPTLFDTITGIMRDKADYDCSLTLERDMETEGESAPHGGDQ